MGTCVRRSRSSKGVSGAQENAGAKKGRGQCNQCNAETQNCGPPDPRETERRDQPWPDATGLVAAIAPRSTDPEASARRRKFCLLRTSWAENGRVKSFCCSRSNFGRLRVGCTTNSGRCNGLNFVWMTRGSKKKFQFHFARRRILVAVWKSQFWLDKLFDRRTLSP